MNALLYLISNSVFSVVSSELICNIVLDLAKPRIKPDKNMEKSKIKIGTKLMRLKLFSLKILIGYVSSFSSTAFLLFNFVY